MTLITIAIIGSESEAHDQQKLWSKVKNVQVIATVPITEAAQGLSDEQLSALLLEDIDVIDVCVSVDQKIELIRTFAREGLSIITSSPLAKRADEASAFIHECKEKNVRIYNRNHLRFSPEYIHAKNEVSNGSLGKLGVNRLSVNMPHPGNGQDIFFNLGIYQFEWLVEAFGRVKRVMAKHVKKESVGQAPVEYSLITLRLEDDSFVHVELRWLGTELRSSFELTGDSGMLTYDSKQAQPIQFKRYSSSEDVGSVGVEGAQVKELESFVNHVDSYSAADSIHALQVAEAAKQSALTGKAVELKEGGIK
ncbi:Gfo/Idh/MocA family protein [Alkalicoccobacillus porphyridii]|uniref:Gfo/Idh/MocA family oxidoreductase n=1 Tax=Alkalicoccobacillus porphyridii TaxID=2597270 RepID=A0A553ZX40_9BACI|nr:Gfo/Idh/MocA family oxidoreductase [Alkalicoccobacillus porphyridii]TSB46027.1 Gfo/Idh/MocA family oxidoreductase [Alkalicoccobacillus porphyridii]